MMLRKIPKDESANCVVIKQHLHKGGVAKPGDKIIKTGGDLADALQRKLVILAPEPEAKEVVGDKVKSQKVKKQKKKS